MRIIGIDPGTGIVGFGLIDNIRHKNILIEAGVIRTPAHQADNLRLKTIYSELKQIIVDHRPSVMVIEKLFFSRNVTTAISVAQARGVILLLAEQQKLEIVEFTPLQIKQSITGDGRAKKPQVQQMVKIMLGLDKVPRPDDCADALAAALTLAK